MTTMQKENILGVPVCITDQQSLIERIHADIAEKRQRFIVAINPEKLLKARKDTQLKALLLKADYPIADGVGILLASRLKGGLIRERVTGIDCMQQLCRAARARGYGVFLYGARPEIVSQAKDKLEQLYPGIRITGTLDGYVQDDEQIIQTINESKADIVFVALGSPKQENWIERNRSRTGAFIFQGVGGSFDVLSGHLKRAPDLFLKLGLEWFYRLLQQPGRIFRQFRLLGFVWLVIWGKS
ncbi:MAG: WecB/TagA/CpsF family glycosyltransferase [Bacillota bacterium]|nr:WecB/TagA/CpsF family glycosyltransferase [Bacillota bacterium]